MPSDNAPPCPSVRLQARPVSAPDFMKYPYPEAKRVLAHLETLPSLKEESKACVRNLLNYRAVRTRARFPRGASAAVLVPLFVGRSGDLYVVLSRRSDALKTFAGDTALPGGRVEAQDGTVEDAARREAFEEVGIPQDKERIPLLCVMEPHLTKGEILVTPVVVLIIDNGLQPNLNSSEVTSIFAQPLVSFLSSTPYLSSARTTDPNNPYHTFTDFPLSKGGTVRLHRFLTGREGEGVKPVFGLTAAVLIKTATIGYGRPPDFEVHPPDAPTQAQQIANALLTPSNPVHIACNREGIDANKTAARVLRLPVAANAARTTEWGKIGRQWKRLVSGGNATDVSSRTNAGKAGTFGSISWDGRAGSKGVQKRVEEVKRRAQDQMHGGSEEGTEGFGAKTEEYKKRARERKERAEENGEKPGEHGEECRDAIPDMAKFGGFLDETQDMANERMTEVLGDRKKLAKARKAYPKILEQVRKQVDEARDGSSRFDREALLAMIPKEGQEGLKGGIEAVKGGIKRGMEHVSDGEGRDHDIERGKEGMRRDLEGMKNYTGKGGDGHNPEQVVSRKRNAKL